MCALTIIWGSAVANNCANWYAYGRWRFKMSFEDSSNPGTDFKGWRYFGGFCGFIVYLTMVGPAKYRHSDLERWSTRVGPF